VTWSVLATALAFATLTFFGFRLTALAFATFAFFGLLATALAFATLAFGELHVARVQFFHGKWVLVSID
jgi:hypothetical protein